MSAPLPLAGPFGSEPFDEVPLPQAPLARTLTQIRFPNQSALATDDKVANNFARALSGSYPVLNIEQEVGFLLTPEGVERREGGARIWRLSSADQVWQVSYAPSFVSLETAHYSSRDDFCERLATVWTEFREVVGRPAVQRIGFRYINRVAEGTFLDQLTAMVRPEVMGSTFAGANIAPIARSLTENLYVRSTQDHLLTRWGILPPGETFDPAIAPQPTVSWILDLDSYRSFDPPMLEGLDVPETVKELGQAAYRYFRWAVTVEFLRFFGGDV